MNNPDTIRKSFFAFGLIVAVISSMIVSGANIVLLAWGFEHFYPTTPEPWSAFFLVYACAFGATPYWLTIKLYLRALQNSS